MKYKVRMRIFSGVRTYTVRFTISYSDFNMKISRLDGKLPTYVLRGILSPRTYSRITPLIQFDGSDGIGYFSYEILSINYVD